MKLSGFVGSGRGKLGNSVFSVRGGETIVRQYQPVVHNPNTVRQQASRKQFTYATQLAVQLKSAIAVGMRPYVRAGVSARNVFVKVNIKNMPHVDHGVISYDEIKVSSGAFCPFFPNTPSFETAQQVELRAQNWDEIVAATPSGYKAGIVVAVYSPDMNSCYTQGVLAGNITVKVPQSYQGLKVQLYGFAIAVPESKNPIATDTEPWRYPDLVGETAYCGSGTIG